MRYFYTWILIVVVSGSATSTFGQWNDYGNKSQSTQSDRRKDKGNDKRNNRRTSNNRNNNDIGNNDGRSPQAAVRPPKMILVKGGGFRMGCNDNPREKPVHIVNLNDFEISAFEITVGDFRKFMDSYTYVTDAEKDGWTNVEPDDSGTTVRRTDVNWQYDVHGRKLPDTCESYPVIHVSWYDAVAYCKWLSKQTGRSYRLPTEAEWEYAAQGGQSHDWAKIKPLLGVVGWCFDNSEGRTHKVGRRSPNSLGLFDMGGNVWEWCGDWFDEAYYTLSPTKSPTGPVMGTERVLRGGAWNSKKDDKEAFFWGTSRVSAQPHDRGMAWGFRVVCDMPKEE